MKIWKLRNTSIISLAALTAFFMTAQVEAIPSFARQTGLNCNTCHTVFPHLTPFGRQFKLRGYTIDYSELIQHAEQASNGDSNNTLEINRIPMVSARVVSTWTSPTGSGINNNGQIYQDAQAGTLNPLGGTSPYRVGGAGPDNGQQTKANLIDSASIYVAGKISTNMGAFIEFGMDGADTGGTFGIGMVDIAFTGTGTLGDKQLVYGIRGVNQAFTADPSNTIGAWGITDGSIGPYSTANTLYSTNTAMEEGGEAYAMWGDFNDGGLYLAIGGYKPDARSINMQTMGYASVLPYNAGTSGYGQGVSGSLSGANNSLDESARVAYFLPSFWHTHVMVGGFGYAAYLKMLNSPYLFTQAGTAAASANANAAYASNNTYGASTGLLSYTDKYSNYGADVQWQTIYGDHLFELFGVYQVQTNNKFYGSDPYSGRNYSGDPNANGFVGAYNGVPIQVVTWSASADYYWKRKYGVYMNYMQQNSKKIAAMDIKGTTLGVAWYIWENVKLSAENTFYSKNHTGAANYGVYMNPNAYLQPWNIAARHFNYAQVKLEFLF